MRKWTTTKRSRSALGKNRIPRSARPATRNRAGSDGARRKSGDNAGKAEQQMTARAGIPILVGLALLSLVLAVPRAASAQDWPSKPVRIVTGFAAGGIGDLGARLLAEYITRTTGQQAVVENRTGAAGSLGMDAVAKAP